MSSFISFKLTDGKPVTHHPFAFKLNNQAMTLTTNHKGQLELFLQEKGVLQIEEVEIIHPKTGYPCSPAQFKVEDITGPLSILPPPVVLDLAVSNQLSPTELNYFKETGNNVLLFIHGFNTPKGHYGHYPKHYTIKNTHLITEPKFKENPENHNEQYVEFISNGCKRTVKCDLKNPAEIVTLFPDLNSHKFYSPPEGESPEERALNGRGAHHWFTHMEYNLNQAAGLKPNHFEHYTRILGVHWPNENGLFRFKQAEKKARQYAKALSELICQLANHHLTINIIGFSLGTRLLLEALNCLEKKNIRYVEHILLWQAALSASGLEEYCDVFHTFNRMTVLFSKEDKVLRWLYRERPALGYSGPKETPFICELLKQNKLVLVDQTPYLKGHSHMKIPSNELFDNIYCHYIMGGKHGIQQFGRFFS